MKSTYVRTQPYRYFLGGVQKKMITPVLGGTKNSYIFKTLNPGHSCDQDPTFGISIYNSSICSFFFCQEIQLKKTPNNFSSVAVPQQQYNSNSVQVCRIHPILGACTDPAKTLFLLPCSTIAPLTAQPLAPSLCNTAWLRATSAAEKDPSVATSKKTSWSSVIPKTHKYSTLVCLICH